MPACAVAVCRNYTKTTKGTDVKYFSFPRDPTTQEEWVWRCGRETGFNISNSRVCSEHFTKEDFERDLMNELLGLPTKRTLKPAALPSINIGCSGQRSLSLSSKDPASSMSNVEAAENGDYYVNIPDDGTNADVEPNSEGNNGENKEICSVCADGAEYLLSKGGRLKKIPSNHKCAETVQKSLNNRRLPSCSGQKDKVKRTRKRSSGNEEVSVANTKQSWSRSAALLHLQKQNERLKNENVRFKKHLKTMQDKFERLKNPDAAENGEPIDWEASYKALKIHTEDLQSELDKLKEAETFACPLEVEVAGEDEEEEESKDVHLHVHDYILKPKRREFLCKNLTEDSQKLLSEAVAAALERTSGDEDDESVGTAKVTMIRDDNISLEQPVIVIELPPSQHMEITSQSDE